MCRLLCLDTYFVDSLFCGVGWIVIAMFFWTNKKINVRVGCFYRGATVYDTQGTCNLHFCNCAISYPFSSSSKKLTVHFIDVQVALWMQWTFYVVVETLNSLLTLRCYRFTALKNLNDTAKKEIWSKENGIQQLKVFFLVPFLLSRTKVISYPLRLSLNLKRNKKVDNSDENWWQLMEIDENRCSQFSWW